MTDTPNTPNPETFSEVENKICIPMSKAPVIPLDDATKEFYINLLKIEVSGNKDSIKVILDMAEEHPHVQVIRKRFEIWFKHLNVSFLASFIISSFGSSIGACLMYVYYTAYMAKQKNIREINAKFLYQYVIPKGIIPDEELKKIWFGQKVEPAGLNTIDYPICAQSLMF
jgi:hypothetical protein